MKSGRKLLLLAFSLLLPALLLACTHGFVSAQMHVAAEDRAIVWAQGEPGAIAAARASRTYDNVILRVLGASRAQLLALQLAEYGLIALVLALVALASGSAMAWAVTVKLFEFEWLPDWPRVIAVLAIGLALILAFALAGSLSLLRVKPAQALRAL